MSAAANAIDAASSIDSGWAIDEPASEPGFQTQTVDEASSVDSGWALDEPVEPPPAPVLTIVADYAAEWEADIENVDDNADGWAISDEEATFFAEGEALATKRRPPTEDFSDLGSVKPESGFLKRLFRRTV